MKRTVHFLSVLGLLTLFAGCQKQVSDTDAIRSGINEHLSSLKSLNLSAMDMNIMSVTIQGNQAQAQVEFRPKTGAPQGAGMQVAYTLSKQNGVWVVENTTPTGGTINHPGPGDNPHMNSNSTPTGSLPNFRELVPGAAGTTSLPPGHPPVNSRGNSLAQ